MYYVQEVVVIHHIRPSKKYFKKYFEIWISNLGKYFPDLGLCIKNLAGI